MIASGDRPGWTDARVADAYCRFTGRYDLYRQTSARLVGLVSSDAPATVLDLCCGTGVTAAEILRALPRLRALHCLDSSPAMLSRACAALTDARITWHARPAERLAELAGIGIDACICNMAIWQLDVEAVLAGLRQILRPTGAFAFNIGYWVDGQAAGTTVRGRIGEECAWRTRLHAAGWQLKSASWDEQAQSWEEAEAWGSVPIFGQFAERLLAPYHHARAAGRTASSPRARVFYLLARPCTPTSQEAEDRVR
jgi:ubiquinone/menaquinone biosynthesis C-methylase UbiE